MLVDSTQAPALAASAARQRPGVWFRPRREPGRFGELGLTRLLLLEIVLLAVGVVVLQRFWGALAGAAFGVLAVAVLFGRSGGRWWTENLVLWAGYRWRSDAHPPHRSDPRLAALSTLAPEVAVEGILGPNDSQLGMGSDGAGWFVVFELETVGRLGVQPPIPLTALVGIAADAEQPGVVVQLVTHTNVREHVSWVVVRLDARAVADSLVDHPDGQVDIPAVLSEVSRRVERLFRRRGLTVGPLGPDDLLDALARSCDLGAMSSSASPREEWGVWRSRHLAQVCFWVRSWPDPDRGTGLLAALSELPAPLVSIAITMAPGHETTHLRCLVRVGALPDRIDEICARVDQLAGSAGAVVSRLDGQHGPAVYASAPTGGGSW